MSAAARRMTERSGRDASPPSTPPQCCVGASRHPDPRSVRIGQIAAGPDAAAVGRRRICPAGRRRPHPLEAVHGRLLMRPAPALAGIDRDSRPRHPPLPFEPVAVVASGGRSRGGRWRAAAGTRPRWRPRSKAFALARLPVAPGRDACPLVLGLLGAATASVALLPSLKSPMHRCVTPPRKIACGFPSYCNAT